MKRPIEFYQQSWQTYQNDTRQVPKYQKALDAFKQAGLDHNMPLSGCMTNKLSALSYMMDDVKRKVNKS